MSFCAEPMLSPPPPPGSPIEILRDYGFIEPYPRIFHYDKSEIQFEIDVNDKGELSIRWMAIPKRDDRASAIVFLKRQIRRLEQVKNINYYEGNPNIPQHEWDLAWSFQQANIEAMTIAYIALESMERGEKKYKRMRTVDTGIMKKDLAGDKPHYDPLNWEFDDLNYVQQTCSNKEIMKFHDHVQVETIDTHYQTMTFMIHPETNDVVMDLDDIVQVRYCLESLAMKTPKVIQSPHRALFLCV